MTEKENVAEVLRALASGSENRSQTARLRDIIVELESAIAAGVSRAAILEALHAHGFTLTPKSFESALYRIRQQQGRVGMPSASQPAVPADDAPPDQPGDQAALNKKQRRERLADQFIKPESANPLLKHITQEKKS